MKTTRAVGLLSLFLAGIPSLSLAQADLVISELLAINESGPVDEDGDHSEFIEIYNADRVTVDMDGWYLSDDPLILPKWRFPSVELPPGGFLVVWASDKDRRNPSGRLHANFKLLGRGEYLGLVAPDGITVVWEYAPFPPQVADFSYGLEMNRSVNTFVGQNAPASAIVPSNGSLGLTWTDANFNDGGWTTGTTGVGYDRNSDYLPLIDIDLRSKMEDINTTAFVRVPFNVSAGATGGSLTLRMKYDDGFIAYINGSRVASANAPGSGSWDSAATGQHDDSAAVVFEEFDVVAPGPLVPGSANVLAIHGLNRNLGSSDFLIVPELEGSSTGILERDVQRYFPRPSPGSGNLQGFSDISQTPEFSVAGTVFSGTVTVSLDVPSPDTVIRVTTNGQEPTESSPAYTGPIVLSDSTLIRARGFQLGLSPSPIVSEGFVGLASSVRNFSSNVAIVLVDNFGRGNVASDPFQPAFMAVFEVKDDGRARLSREPDLQTRIGWKIRGSSTQNRPKKAYRLEAWDEKNEDKDIEPLGLPRESDWILYGAYNFDRSLMRNAFIYELSNQVGRYAVRTVFCEVYINTGGGSLAQNDHVGVYSFMESVKRGPDRVDVEKLTASHASEPEITGGYMLKIDRLDPGDSGVNGGGQRMGWVYPKEEYVTGTQSTWVRNYFNAFQSALNGGNFRDPALGYARYVDVDSWIDHHILNVLPMNVDALRLSTYFFKKRGGKIEYGPIWDFDRSMESTDGRDDNPRTWSGSGGTDFFNYPWWKRLFDDPDFWQRWTDRWHELRQNQLSVANMNSILNGMQAEIAEAAVRNFQTWTLINPSQFPGEVNRVKNYLSTRAGWIDSQFLGPPTFSWRGGSISPGLSLSLSAPQTIYYTMDGSDPRARGGAVAAGATQYSGSITINDNARVVARTRTSSTEWSAPNAETYVVTTPRLVITEVMYNPPDPHSSSLFDAQDFEFVEVMNATDEDLDLAGFHFTDGVDFMFSGGNVLSPGEFAVVVRNLEAFEDRYGTRGIRIEGEYSLALDNNGERVALAGPLEEPIVEFEYVDLWYPTTDGIEDSLNIADPFAPLDTWDDQESWLPSSVLGGTPGGPDGGLPALGGRVRIGDSNLDGLLDLTDAVSLLRRLFGGSSTPLPCEGGSVWMRGDLVAFDVNDDTTVNLTDVIHILGFLFQNGPAPVLGTACVYVSGCANSCDF